MSRNRFTKLKANFHIANNDNLDVSDKFAKVRPLFDMLNKRYMQFGVFVENLSIDETMVPYFGRHSAKCLYVENPYVLVISCGRFARTRATCFSLSHIQVHPAFTIRAWGSAPLSYWNYYHIVSIHYNTPYTLTTFLPPIICFAC